MPRRTRLVSSHERQLADAHLHPLEVIFKHGDVDEFKQYFFEQLEKRCVNDENLGHDNRFDEEELISHIGSQGHEELFDAILELNSFDEKRALFNRWFPGTPLGSARFSATIFVAAAEHNQWEFLSHAAETAQQKKFKGLVSFAARNKRGMCALDESARCDHVECIKVLVTQCGVNVNDVDKTDMMTAAHVACEAGAMEALSTLFALGADIKRRTACGDSCLNLAKQCGNRAIMSWLLQYGLRDDANTNVASSSASGYTPKKGSGSWVSALLAADTAKFFALVGVFAAFLALLVFHFEGK